MTIQTEEEAQLFVKNFLRGYGDARYAKDPKKLAEFKQALKVVFEEPTN